LTRFLIIRFSSIGDIVLTTPVIRCLKQQIEDVEIHYLTKKQFGGLLENNPYIDKLWLLDKNFDELLSQIRKTHIDYIIDLHHNLRTQRLKNKLSILSFSFNKLNYAKWMMVNFKKNRLPDVHIVDRYLDTLSSFDVENDGKGLDFFPGNTWSDLPKEAQKQLPDRYIALAIGAQHFTKKAPPEKLAMLIDNLSLPVIILGGPADTGAAESIISRSLKKDTVNLAGKISLDNSAFLVSKAEAIVTHDTGLMHIAAAFGKKIMSIWGNTIPEFGMYPYQAHPASRIFEVKDLPCRPCSKIGFQQCPKKHFRCMMDQDMMGIAQYVNRETETGRTDTAGA